MSDIVQMTADVGEFLNGNIYRVRSRFAHHRELENKLVVLENEDVVVADPIEGE